MNFLLPADLGQAILNYLVQRPYAEVHEMVRGLQALQPEPELADPDKD